MNTAVEALRISPKYTSHDWFALKIAEPDDWIKAATIVRDRLEGRFLRFADAWLSDRYSGFVVLAIDSLMAETLQLFKSGEADGKKKSGFLVTTFLAGPRFQPDFDKVACKRFYEDIRCGLLHQAEARNMWLVRRKQNAMLQKIGDGQGYIIDVGRFHDAIRGSLQDYYMEIKDPSGSELRTKLWKKMNQICSVRSARGLLYEAHSKVHMSIQSES